MISIKKSDLNKIKNALLNNVGDHRKCPFCKNDYIPIDATANEALEALNIIKSYIK